MKRLSLLLAMLVLMVCQLAAVPAHPGKKRVMQPDGNFVTIQLQGDEWRHFTTTTDGYSVVKNKRGFYVYADKKNGCLTPTEMVAHDVPERMTEEHDFLKSRKKYLKPSMSPKMAMMKKATIEQQHQTLARRRAARRATDYENFRGLVILVEFNDRKFSRKDYPVLLYDMLNKDGFSGYIDDKGEMQKCTGSVFDYFYDNSQGKFQPHFDIAGPYTVDFSQYDSQLGYNGDEEDYDPKFVDIMSAAIDSADVDIDFSQYDGNGDGKVDLVFFIMAGLPSSIIGNNPGLWWPHRSFVYSYNRKTDQYDYIIKDGVRLWDYASSTELDGSEDSPESVVIDGIGSIVHEFSHVLGLPDFYDTDDEESGGLSCTLGEWSVMDLGCYNNMSRTPSGYSLFERYIVHFIDEIPDITAAGSYELEPLPLSNVGLCITTPESKEFFLLENRQKDAFMWDAYLPGNGMLVYHWDKSRQDLWNSNMINSDPSHNYFEIVRARAPFKWDEYYIATATDAFPGPGYVSTLNSETKPGKLVTWSGKAVKWGLRNIRMARQIISFDVEEFAPNAIHNIITDNAIIDSPRYNLQGQYVDKGYKGLVIVDGRIIKLNNQ